MNVPIGFVILVNPFNPLDQTERLIRKLNSMFNFPPIACHFDFGKNPHAIVNLPDNVKVVSPHVNTKWADFTCIDAAVKALRLLYSGSETPDWFVYLSGADYPVKSADRILSDLQSSPFDAHIEHIWVDRNAPSHTAPEKRPESHKGASWPQGVTKRYGSIPVTFPWLTKRLQFHLKTIYLQNPVLVSWKLPFTSKFLCFGGEAWFCANRHAAGVILTSYEKNTRLVNHYRRVLCPEESYFHTILANDPGLHLSQDPLRYMDWTAGGNHPKLLNEEDLAKLANTNAHFARKFPDKFTPKMSEVLEELTS